MNTVMPGAILTEDGYWEKIKNNNKSKYFQYIKERMACGRFGKPEEIAALVLFLCSNYSSFSVGSSYLVDGGNGRSFKTF